MKSKHYTKKWHSALLHYYPPGLLRHAYPILFSWPGDHEMVDARAIGILLPPGKVSVKLEGVPDRSLKLALVFNLGQVNFLFPGDRFLTWLKLHETMLKLQRADSQNNRIERQSQSTINM